jgi:TRAP transporter TAXI family solute receptor
VQTLQANALLVARKGLSAEVVQTILDALFDEVDDLAVANIRANEIRLWKAFDLPDEDLKLHPGAEKFKEMEKYALLVATGSIAGKYYNQGQMIQLLLQERVIRTLGDVIAALWEQARTDLSVIPPLLFDQDRARARVVHTNGSLENARLVGQRPTLAIMQYDVALASRREKSSIYRTELAGVEFPELPDLKRIATLDTETLYVIARLERLDEKRLEGSTHEEDVGTVRSLKGLRVCLGPEHSGTRAIAEAVLEHHGILDGITPSYLIVPDMVHRLHSGEIDAGFIVSGLPSHAIETLLDDPRLRLLSLGARERAKIVESAPFGSVSIHPNKYASQPPNEAIRTIATRAVLVTNADLPFDVETITEAVFEGAAFLGIGGSALEVTAPAITTGESLQKRLLRFMAQPLPSLPLHPGAKAYYERAGLLPHDPGFVDLFYDWLTATWRGLAVLLILVTGYIGFISLTRDRTSNRIGRDIFKIVLDDGDSSPVSQLKRLAKKRAVINELVPQRYFREDLDKPRWRELNDLIEYWMGVAKNDLTRDLADEIGSDSSDESLIDKQRLDRGKDLSQRVRKHFEDDELEASQYEMLTKLIQEELSERA